MRSPDHAALVVDKIAAQIDPHLENWAMNAAAAVTTTAETIRNLEFTPVREIAGVIMGKAFADPALDMDYLGRIWPEGAVRLRYWTAIPSKA